LFIVASIMNLKSAVIRNDGHERGDDGEGGHERGDDGEGGQERGDGGQGVPEYIEGAFLVSGITL
jgi:hypothetical protein